MKVKSLKLILGDQLNPMHSWFDRVDDEVIFVIAELHQETNYTKHHIQKVTAFFAAMEDFATYLQSKGHRVCYLTLDDTARHQNLNQLLTYLALKYQCESLSFQRPDEFRLRKQLLSITDELAIPINEIDTEHFLLSFEELPQHFQPTTHVRMESFYRYMRKRFKILMEGKSPEGGAWNFDAENRKTFKNPDLKIIPKPLVFKNSGEAYLQRLNHQNIMTIGQPAKDISYPINRKQSLQLLRFFCENLLINFGKFQDAMTTSSPYAWSLYHSRLSFSLNCKMLSPQEVIQTALHTFHHAKGEISLAQIEGFIRQILGWREYVRGMYWANMPNYSQQNYLNAQQSLPSWFWDGNTKMHCLHKAISQSLEHAYAHHIQRLMITGNFALLAGIVPQQVDDWYLGIYIDAIEWVELPNTRGMALFADGGWIATKPYAASGNYVNKMSNYCKQCYYNVKEKTGPTACPLNSLYWNFINKNHDKFSTNHRMSFPVRHWDKMDIKQKTEIKEHAKKLLININNL